MLGTFKIEKKGGGTLQENYTLIEMCGRQAPIISNKDRFSGKNMDLCVGERG